MSDTVACSTCHAINRLVPGRSLEEARCGKCGNPLAQESGPVIVTDDTFEHRVVKSSLPVLVDLWAPWCGPCRSIAPVLEDLARKYHGRLLVAKLNVDENPYTARQMEAMSIPLLLFMKDGRVLQRLVGAYPATEIEKAVRVLVGENVPHP
ncbi:MAG: thioredoxin [Nitrospirae bacterium]|nr:thioredoxin [Nitrospirota bacterium]